jgi:DNA-binding CsgD family transcriptional regulator
MQNQKSFSPREAEIVRRLAVGEPQKSIAIELHISISAVETYIDRAKEKVGARTVVQLVLISIGPAARQD